MSSTAKTGGIDIDDKARDEWYDVCDKFKAMGDDEPITLFAFVLMEHVVDCRERVLFFFKLK
jgi:hypothetical protein